MQLSTINLSITRAYGGGVAAFSPSSLFASGEQGAWYDPSDLSTMFQDAAGTTPVTGVGQPVGLILDKSGNGNNATQATAAARPLLQNDGVNNYLEFDGVDDYLDTAVINKSAWTGGFGIAGHVASSGNGGLFGGLSSVVPSNHEPFTDETWYCSFGTASRSDGMGVMGYGSKYVTSRLRDSTTSTYRINASQVGSSVTPTDFGGSSIIRVGSGYVSGVGYYLAGNIYSIIIRGATSTQQEIDQTEAWVADKTGVTLP